MNTRRAAKDSSTQDIVRKVALTDRGMLTLRPRRGQWLRIVEGTVHLTRDGLPQDVFLVAGRRWPVQSPGNVLVEAHGPVRLIVVRPATLAERLLSRVKSALRSSSRGTSRSAHRAARRAGTGGRILL